MRTWFNKHPNVAFVLLGLCTIWMAYGAVDALDDRRWGWAIAGFGAMHIAARRAGSWWGRT
jgi:hypothetical protein